MMRAVAVVVAGTAALAPSAEPPFEDVAADAGLTLRNLSGSPDKRYIVESTGSGGCFFDYDADGDLDLYVVNGGSFEGELASDALYRNDGARFEDVTRHAGIEETGWGAGCAVGDLDNDGDPDLYVTQLGADALYRNHGDGTFRRPHLVEAASGVSSSAAFADLDHDADLDLIVGTYLAFDRETIPALEDGRCHYRGVAVYCGPDGLDGASNRLLDNRGDGSFEDVTEASGIAREDAKTLGLVVSDLDGDGLADIYAACDSTINLFLRNLGGMRFEDLSLLSGAGYSGRGFEQSGMGVTAGDPDGDGDRDLFVTNFHNDTNTFYRNTGAGAFQDVTDRVGLGAPSVDYLSWGTHFADFDNDGDEDLFVASGHVYPQAESLDEPYRQRMQLFENRHPEPWVERDLDLPPVSGRGTAVGDFDDDGHLDVFVNRIDDTPSLLRGLGRVPGRRSVKLRLVGVDANRDALGALVTLAADGRAQQRELRSSDGYLGSNDPRLHFGLGDSPSATASVVWPGGAMEAIGTVEPGLTYVVKQGQGIVAVQKHGSGR